MGTFSYAQQPDYFPLKMGNIWVYQCTGVCGTQAALAVRVGPTKNINGTAYSQLQGWFGGDYWVREDSNGEFWEYDQNTQQENLWYAFGTSAGGTYSESIPTACCGQATLQSTNSSYQGPVGSYDTALEIDYPGVSQTGVSREFFLPYVGLVSHAALAGGFLATYDLIYARLGEVTVVSRQELSTGLALDRAVYSLADSPVLTARLSILNSTSDPLLLTFSTSQEYELEILDNNGKLVYQWSTGKVFAQAMTTISFLNETDYIMTVPLVGVSPGIYVARGWLTAIGPRHAYSASTSFEVK
jgi:hypothetical protein